MYLRSRESQDVQHRVFPFMFEFLGRLGSAQEQVCSSQMSGHKHCTGCVGEEGKTFGSAQLAPSATVQFGRACLEVASWVFFLLLLTFSSQSQREEAGRERKPVTERSPWQLGKMDHRPEILSIQLSWKAAILLTL